MKSGKRMMLLMFLLVFLSTAVFPVTAAAAIVDSGTCGDGVTWTLDSDGVLTISGNGAISTSAFEANSSIVSVIIEEGITDVGAYTFDFCNNLKDITFASSVKSIGSYAFYGCSNLTEVVMVEGLQTIGAYSFGACDSVSEISLPESLLTIEDSAFNNCVSLTNIIIPRNVYSIGIGVFGQCEALQTIFVDDENEHYSHDGNGALCSKDKTVIVSVPCGVQEYSISSDVVSIESKAFYGCNLLHEIVVPENVTHIGDSSFAHCDGLSKIVIPNSVVDIGSSVFFACDGIESVRLSESIQCIDGHAFSECVSLKYLEIPKSVIEIGYLALSNCESLTEIRFYGHAPTIQSDALQDVTATAYYPSCGTGWDTAITDSYSGEITWIAYDHVGDGEKCELCGTLLNGIGHINSDGIIDALDANLIYSFFNEITGVSFTETQIAAADVNGDDVVDALDANLVYSFFNEVITAFPNA